jgi:hypothetical protein
MYSHGTMIINKVKHKEGKSARKGSVFIVEVSGEAKEDSHGV